MRGRACEKLPEALEKIAPVLIYPVVGILAMGLLMLFIVEPIMGKYGVAPELIKDFIGTLNECEFARYAPGNQNEAMDKVYSSAVEVISKMENSIKH